MISFKDKHKGETCYILGNGPSLKDVNWDLVHGRIFATNGFYDNPFDVMPDYMVSVNKLVLDQWGDEIGAMKCPKFVSQGIIGDDVHVLNTSLSVPKFETDMEKPIWEGHTVTFVCLQLAYYMGFTKVILLGVDHDFGDVTEPNKEVVASGPDMHHFRANYFPAGSTWNLPDLKNSELAYALARTAYEKVDRIIVNCSASTKLDVFEKQRLGTQTKLSAIVSAYYAKEYLEGCLDDLEAQTLKPEVIVVCKEGSDSHQIASKRDCVIITTEDVPTVYKAWNLGIKFATGEYITNANTDDRHHKDAYQIMANVLDGYSDIDLVYHDSYITWEDNQTYEEFDKDNLVLGRFEGQSGIFSWPDYKKSLLADGCFMGPHPMWRANLIQKHGLFNQELTSAGDYDYWLRIAESDNFFHIKYPLGLYLARENGVELSNLAKNADEAGVALMVNQTGDVQIRPVSPQLVRVSLGDEWAYVNYNDLKRMVDRLG